MPSMAPHVSQAFVKLWVPCTQLLLWHANVCWNDRVHSPRHESLHRKQNCRRGTRQPSHVRPPRVLNISRSWSLRMRLHSVCTPLAALSFFCWVRWTYSFSCSRLFSECNALIYCGTLADKWFFFVFCSLYSHTRMRSTSNIHLLLAYAICVFLMLYKNRASGKKSLQTHTKFVWVAIAHWCRRIERHEGSDE